MLLGLLAFWLAWQAQEGFRTAGVELTSAVVRAGLLRFVGAALCFVAARLILIYPRTEPEAAAPATERVEERRTISLWRLALAGLGLLGWLGVMGSLAQLDTRDLSLDLREYALTWLVALVLVVGAMLPAPRVWPGGVARAMGWLRRHRWEVLALVGITLLAGVLRLWNLSSGPFTVSGDEGSIGTDVLRIVRGELRNPFGLMWGPLPSLSGFWMAPAFQLFGPSVFALRLMGALIGTLAIPALYALARLVAGRRVALAAALLLAALPMHQHYSRVSVAVVPDSFFFTAALALLWWGLRRAPGSRWPFVLAGLIGGIGQYSYSGSRLLPLLVAAFLVFLFLFHRARLVGHGAGLGAMALIFLVTAGPLYLFALRFPNDFNTRINQVGVFQSGWLTAETALRGQGPLGVLWDQFRRTLFGFAFFADRTETWGPDGPLASPLFSLPLFLGLVVSLRRWRDPATVLLHGWFWAIILAGALTVNPPTSNRLVGITPMLCLFAALGWDAVARSLGAARTPGTARRVQAAVLALLVGLTVASGVREGQQYLARNNFGGGNARVATRIGYDLAARAEGTTLVLLGPPRLYADTEPLPFLTFPHTRLSVDAPLTAAPTTLPTFGDLLIIVLPERVAELLFLQQAFPTVVAESVYDPDTDELLFHRMVVDR